MKTKLNIKKNTKMKMKTVLWSVLPISVVFLFLSFTDVTDAKANADKTTKADVNTELNSQAVYIPKVQTKILEEKTIKNTILLTGELEALAVVDIKSKVQGRVENLTLKNGQEASEALEVKAGETIAILDHLDFQTRLDQAQAGLKAAEVGVKMSKMVLEDKRLDKTRMENLFVKGAISLKQKELAVLDYKRCFEQLNQAKANLALSKAAFKGAELLYKEAFILAPFDGTLIRKYVSLGDLVGPGAPLFRVQKIDELKLLIKIPERILSQMRIGTEVEVKVDALENQIILSKVEKIYPVVDPLSRSITVELRIKNSPVKETEAIKTKASQKQLFPGMFATAKLILEKKERAIAVPASSIIKGGFVYVFKENKVHLKKINLGLKENDLVEVVSGLSLGEEIVVFGQNKLSDGASAERVKTN